MTGQITPLRSVAATAALAIAALFPLAGVAGAQAEPDRDCPSFSSQAEAQEFFEARQPGDSHRLDADDDGIACEDPDGNGPPPNGNGQGTVDNGETPSGGVETGHGGTAGGDGEVVLSLGLAGGTALAAGTVVMIRRRHTGTR